MRDLKGNGEDNFFYVGLQKEMQRSSGVMRNAKSQETFGLTLFPETAVNGINYKSTLRYYKNSKDNILS